MKTSVIVKIDENQYEVRYPNVGEKLQIENVKLLLTDNRYGDLARSGHITATKFLDIVDAVSYFTILIPDLKKTLKYEDFLEMDPIRSKTLITAFKKQYSPFYDSIENELNSDEDESEDTIEV